MLRFLFKLPIMRLDKPRLCPYCLKRLTLGDTPYGIIGCQKCQDIVDDAVNNLPNIAVLNLIYR